MHERDCATKARTDIVQLRNSPPSLPFLLCSSISFPFSRGPARLPSTGALFVRSKLPQAHPVFTSRVPRIDTVCLIFGVTHGRWRCTWHFTQFRSFWMSQSPFQKKKAALKISSNNQVFLRPNERTHARPNVRLKCQEFLPHGLRKKQNRTMLVLQPTAVPNPSEEVLLVNAAGPKEEKREKKQGHLASKVHKHKNKKKRKPT